MGSRVSYTRVSTRETSPPLLGEKYEHDDTPEERETGKRRSKQNIFHWMTHGLSLSVILALIFHVWSGEPLQPRCHRLFNYYSPMSKDLESQPYVETRFNGSLWHKSPFKGPPSKSSIEAWDSIKEFGIISATEDDLVRINRSHSLKTASKFPEIAGGGYVAMTMGTHQLHCLSWLWRDHHRSYFPEMMKNKEAIPEMYERHFEHCVDFIRQTLMCNFDMGLLTFDWVLDHPNPVPNTNSMHKCVDWSAAETWMKNRAVEVPEGFKWAQPEGQETLPWNP